MKLRAERSITVILAMLAPLLAGNGCRPASQSRIAGWQLRGVQPVEGQVAIFSPGVISTEAWELNAAFNPAGDEFYFTRANADWSEMSILLSRWDGSHWSDPKPLPFNNGFVNADPHLAHDGKRLYFASKRDALGRAKGDFDIWYVDRAGEHWGEPHPVHRVNTEYDEVCPQIMPDGSLLFTSKRPDGAGQFDVYRAEWGDDRYGEPVMFNPPVNSPLTEVDATLSPDGNLLFFAGHGREDGLGRGDIYVCVKRGNGWSSPVNLGEPVNSDAMELCPVLALDGRTLFFASTRSTGGGVESAGQTSNIYVVDLMSLPVVHALIEGL